MDKRIIYTRADGGVSVVVPAPKGRRAVTETVDDIQIVRPETDDEFIERLKQKIPADATDITVCDVDDIISDRTFRDAWKKGSLNIIDVDMPMARDIHMNRIRTARNAVLANLDVPQQQALVAKDEIEIQRIETEKQALRDIPQTLDLTVATTPEELKAIWPEDLPRE